MSIETGVVVDYACQPIHWHEPKNRSSVHLADSRDLWDIFWENRKHIAGFAHSHPGSGWPEPSNTDLTTFSAVELALGDRLFWWITSADRYIVLTWRGPGPYDYKSTKCHSPIGFIDELRLRS